MKGIEEGNELEKETAETNREEGGQDKEIFFVCIERTNQPTLMRLKPFSCSKSALLYFDR